MKNILSSALIGITAPFAYAIIIILAETITGPAVFNKLILLTHWSVIIYKKIYCPTGECSTSGRPGYEMFAIWLFTNFIIFSCLGYIFLRWWQKRRTNVRRSQM
jgi:hypothetical protein